MIFVRMVTSTENSLYTSTTITVSNTIDDTLEQLNRKRIIESTTEQTYPEQKQFSKQFY